MIYFNSELFGQIQIINSSRKTVAVTINDAKQIILRAPYGFNTEDGIKIINSKKDWIYKTLDKINNQEKENINKIYIFPSEIRKLTAKAKFIFPKKVNYYANIIGVNYNNLTIKAQKTLWGSCSSKGNINLNCILVLFPDEIIDYVIIHELCHRKFLNHSKDFWNEVKKYDKNFKSHKEWLKLNGSKYIIK